MNKHLDVEFIEEKVVIDGIEAVRRRKKDVTQKRGAAYLHIQMECVSMLSRAGLPSAGWSLGLWVIWYYMVSSGQAASITATFAERAGVKTRATRRHAISALEASGLFDLNQKGKEAAKVSPTSKLMAALNKNKLKGR